MKRNLFIMVVLIGVIGFSNSVHATQTTPVVAKWDCATPIEVYVNVSHWRHSTDPVYLAQEAVIELKKLTRLPLVWKGVTITSWYNYEDYTGERAIIIEWFPEERHPGTWGWANVYRGSNNHTIVGASVALTNSVPTPKFVLLHELAHAVGLNHSSASEGLMAVGAPDPRTITIDERKAFNEAGCKPTHTRLLWPKFEINERK